MLSPHEPTTKKDYDIPRMFRLIRQAVKNVPKAMLFQLYDEGYRAPFEQLVACLLSVRTLDEVSLVAARGLLNRARTPERILALKEDRLLGFIHRCTFPGQKAKQLKKLSTQIINDYGGELPCDFESLTALTGIGPKCANLVLGISCGQASIGVDIHVHRVTNRWGYVYAATPEKTMAQLESRLPRSRWVEINELLVPFGKHICQGFRPKCSVCPVLEYCRQIGVKNPR